MEFKKILWPTDFSRIAEFFMDAQILLEKPVRQTFCSAR